MGFIMASGHSDYIPGTMPIDGHKKTFDGFIASSKFFSAALIVILLMPTLVFCTPLGWGSSLIITFVIGVIVGLLMKLGGAWYGTLVGLSILMGLISILASMLAG